jgi:hypothetical protein
MDKNELPLQAQRVQIRKQAADLLLDGFIHDAVGMACHAAEIDCKLAAERLERFRKSPQVLRNGFNRNSRMAEAALENI